MAVGLRRMTPLAMAVLFGMTLLIGGCDTGSRNETGPPPPPPPPVGTPRLISVGTQNGSGGDEITIVGENFNLDPMQNSVVFVASDLSGVDLAGEVISVTQTGTVGGNAQTTMVVRVPTGVRNSNIDLDVVVDGELTNALVQGSTAFCGDPVILGAIYGNDNEGFFSVDLAGGVTPGSVIIYGYNVGILQSATFTDESANIVAAATITPGLPMGVTFTLPTGIDAATVELPNGLTLNDCADSAIAKLNVTTACANDGTILNAQEVDIRFRKDIGGSPGDMPATIVGCIVPFGVHAGDIEITYSLLSEPASEEWDMLFEFEPVFGTGVWQTCTPAEPGQELARVCGVAEQGSTVGGIVGPGHIHKFVWASGADLPGANGKTRVRLTPVPEPSTNFLCEPTIFITEPIGYNNDIVDVATFMGSATIDEDFATSQFLGDPGMAPQGELDVAAGVLRGTAVPGAVDSPFSTGMADIVLEAFREYEIFTDGGDITDVTDPNSPIPLFGVNPNPGDGDSEFHVRTFICEPDAVVTIVGDAPLVVRCSGTGNAEDVVCRIDGILDVSGEDGTDGTSTAAGTGGLGLAGGGNGGDGGAVDTNATAQLITNVDAATDGGNNGGKAGQNTTFATQDGSTSQGRGAPGGGGGHLTAGEDGLNANVSLPAATPAKGGPARGSDDRAVRTAGSGGGGGGGAPFRLSPTNPQLQARYGGGGGAGGGSIDFIVDGTISVAGQILANGGAGERGTPGTSAGGGGGGSGGGIGLFATGGISLTDTSLLVARGGDGGGQQPNFLGGAGADGRIRLEANGGVNYSGLVDFTGLQPSLNSPGVTAGVASGTIDSGTAVDGSLDLTGEMGEFTINTNTGAIIDPAGMTLLTSMSGNGEFNFLRMVVPVDVTIRAFGDNPLIFRVQQNASVAGIIDVSGTDGGVPDFMDPANPTPGIAGIGGAAGASGGEGGISDGTNTIDGGHGSLPGGLPASLVGSVPPFGGGGSTGSTLPTATADPAGGGETVAAGAACGAICTPGAGGGGGYAQDGSDASGVADAEHGVGGSSFGNSSFVDPATGALLQTGGGGGAGGGASNSSPDGIAAHSPGSGGGASGGYLEINVGGVFQLESTAQILAEGGDSYRAAAFGGNGGGGAGGAIVLRGNGLNVFDAPTISVSGGLANQDPSAFANYMPNSDNSGGNGSSGRIRIESPIGFNTAPPVDCAAVQIPTSGVCPDPTIGAFLGATAVTSFAQFGPYPVGPGGDVTTSGAEFQDAVVTPTPIAGGAPTVQILYRGWTHSVDVPGTIEQLSGFASDPTGLTGASFFEVLYLLYGAPLPGGGVTQPTVDNVSLPIDF